MINIIYIENFRLTRHANIKLIGKKIKNDELKFEKKYLIVCFPIVFS